MKPANRYALYRLTTLDSGRVKGTLIKDLYLKLENSPVPTRVPTVLFGRELLSDVLNVNNSSLTYAFNRESVIRNIYILKLNKDDEVETLKSYFYPKVSSYHRQYRMYNSIGNPIEDIYTKDWFIGLTINDLIRRTFNRESDQGDRNIIANHAENEFELNGYLVRSVVPGVDAALKLEKDSPYQHCATHVKQYPTCPATSMNVYVTPIAVLPKEFGGVMYSSVCVKCATDHRLFDLINAFLSKFRGTDKLEGYLKDTLVPKYNMTYVPQAVDIIMRSLLNPCDLRYTLRLTSNFNSNGSLWGTNSPGVIFSPDGTYGSIAEHVIDQLSLYELNNTDNWASVIEEKIFKSLKDCKFVNTNSQTVTIDWFDPTVRGKVVWYLHFIMYCSNN